ncbi:MAG: hypothetical protein KF878_10675 [Planctomycetes bacterium]|nr:hypothetical protein [Planctomycetota bacterium]
MTPEHQEQLERLRSLLASPAVRRLEQGLVAAFVLLVVLGLIGVLASVPYGQQVAGLWLMLGCVLPVAGVLLLLALPLGHMRRLRAVAARWDEVARARGLEATTVPFTSSDWRLSGDMHGVPVAVRTVRRGQGDSSRTATIVQVTLPERTPADLRLSVEGFGDRLMKALGGQDVQVGDREVDALLRVRGDDPEAIQTFLHRPAVLDALRALGTHHRSFTVERALARIEEPRFVKDPEEVMPTLDRLVALARALGA